MPVSYFACQGLGCCQMRSMLLLTKYNLFLHYRANTSCGSWVGYNSECHWVMDWLRSGNEANNTEQHSAKHKQAEICQTRPGVITRPEPLTVTPHWKLCHLTWAVSQPCGDRSNVAQNYDTDLMFWWPQTQTRGGDSISIIMTLLELINKRPTHLQPTL